MLPTFEAPLTVANCEDFAEMEKKKAREVDLLSEPASQSPSTGEERAFEDYLALGQQRHENRWTEPIIKPKIDIDRLQKCNTLLKSRSGETLHVRGNTQSS